MTGSTDKPIATIQFTDTTEIRDIENLKTVVNKCRQYEATVKIDGSIEVRRTDD